MLLVHAAVQGLAGLVDHGLLQVDLIVEFLGDPQGEGNGLRHHSPFTDTSILSQLTQPFPKFPESLSGAASQFKLQTAHQRQVTHCSGYTTTILPYEKTCS